ncbi:MAG: hypothetical protein ABL918_10095 [Chakrabartia sp.]
MNLRKALIGNAIFTSICGLSCLLTADLILAHIAVPDRIWIIGLGMLLLSYVPMLLVAAARPLIWLVRVIILLDWGYVAIVSVFLMSNWKQIDIIGFAMILPSTTLVALFALLQQTGLSHMIQERSK